MTRRDVLEFGIAAGALTMTSKGLAAPRVDGDEAFWTEVANAFPAFQGPVHLANSGGGTCPTTTLDLLARYERIAAAGGEDTDPVLAALKESGSSAPLRAMMAKAFGCGADEIALTRNAMEGLAVGLLGVDLRPGDEVLTTRADYDSCLLLLRQREKRNGIKLKLIDFPMPASTDDEVVAAFEQGCSPRTKLILMCHMYNKNGQIIPVRRITDMARARGILTLVDGAQSTGQLDFCIADLGCDMFATSLHKWVYAPRGTGFLHVRRDVIERVWPIWPSWSGKPATSIEKFEDVGTASKAVPAALPSVFAFNERIGATRREARLRHLRDLWLNPILRSGRVTLLTDRNPARSCAITAFRVEGMDPDKLASALRERHGLLIGTIHLADKPELTGNYLAANLRNTPEQMARFAEAFRAVVSKGG